MNSYRSVDVENNSQLNTNSLIQFPTQDNTLLIDVFSYDVAILLPLQRGNRL